MTRISRCARRFFWWCAAADAALLDAPDVPRLDGIKYAAVGALVCLTTTVAACGWMHNAATMLADKAYGIPLALGLGLLMGALVFCMERVLVVSIRQDTAIAGRLAAIAWRGLIALISAMLITTPFALAYFSNGILARLDDEKLALMAQKRQEVAAVFDLKGRAAAIADIDRNLASNRAEREQLPADLQELSAAVADCEHEYATLQHSLEPKIATAGRRYAETLRQIGEDPEEATYLRRRLGALGGQIGRLRKQLADKEQACRAAADRFAAAKQGYQERLDRQWQEEQARKQAAQRTLDQTQQSAGAMVTEADGVVVKLTAPDLSARIRALGQMAERDRLVAAVLAILYGFFFLVEIMPVLAKLVMRTVYDRRVTGEHRRAIAQIDADAVLAEADAAMRGDMAEVERLAVEALLREAGGSEVARELAKSRVAAELAKVQIVAPLAQIDALIEAYRRTQARADDIAERYAGRPDLFPHIEAVREALSKAMERAAGSTRSQPSRAPSA